MEAEQAEFNPEIYFEDSYWGEVLDPIAIHRTDAASRSDVARVSQLLAKTSIPVLSGELRGNILQDGETYNPSNPNLPELPQHAKGAVLLVDREQKYESHKKPFEIKALPLNADSATELHMPSREFITNSWQKDSNFSLAWRSRVVWHDGFCYSRSVNIEAIALQAKTKIPVIYQAKPMNVEVMYGNHGISWKTSSEVAEIIGRTYRSKADSNWRIRSVEICLPDSLSSESATTLGKLATN